jgi:3-hydroxymyristoyl/3-hydroxydecanoyl-(acyl carrier protein) dehydratase
MDTDWSVFKESWQDPDGSLRARGAIESSTPWLDGHFPDWPVLPGVAMVHGLLMALESVLGGPVELKNVRFRHLVSPGACLELRCSAPSDRGREFRVEVGGAMACSGLVAPMAAEASG